MDILKKISWILLCFIPFLGQTQEDEREDKIERLKIAYITRELNLTSDEAQKFWPIYNEAEAKLRELRKANRKLNEEAEEAGDKLTDEEAKKKIAAVLENENKEAEIKKEYSEKIAKVIGYKRALKLLSLEQKFRRELLETLRDRQGPPPPRPQKPHGERP